LQSGWGLQSSPIHLQVLLKHSTGGLVGRGFGWTIKWQSAPVHNPLHYPFSQLGCGFGSGFLGSGYGFILQFTPLQGYVWPHSLHVWGITISQSLSLGPHTNGTHVSSLQSGSALQSFPLHVIGLQSILSQSITIGDSGK